MQNSLNRVMRIAPVRRLLAFLGPLLTIGTFIAPAFAEEVFVHGYTQRDGTYVPPHWRSAPDRSDDDNWTRALNTNPYTGQQGTRAPDASDMQWRRPVPSFGNVGNQNLGGTQRFGW